LFSSKYFNFKKNVLIIRKSGPVNRSSDWKLDMNEVRKVATNKTKMIIVNTPHNPLGIYS